MHIPHDTRRGSSRYLTAPGYAEADSIEDTAARARAIDAVRQRVLREEAGMSNVPSAHQLNSALADALGLALNPHYGSPDVSMVLGRAMRRAMRYRGFDPDDQEIHRRLVIRLRPQQRIQDWEASERIRKEVAEEQARRRLTSTDVVDLAAMFAGLDEDEPVD